MSCPVTSDDHNSTRHVLYPIQHQDVWALYKKAQSAYWTAEELELAKDSDDWDVLSDNERHFIKHVLAFFAASDGIVMENLAARFMTDVKIPEARAFYAFQIAIETVHSEVYALLLDSYVKDSVEKSRLFHAVTEMPCIAKKANWALKWISDFKSTFAERLVAFACIEGIFFSGAFCAIFWVKERGILPGLCSSNEFISRDEAMHTDLACLLYSKLHNKADPVKVLDIVLQAQKIEHEFITSALPCALLGMNAGLMGAYIEFVTDRLLLQLGLDKHFETKNPFAFMDRIALQTKANFFEHRESNYSKAQSERVLDFSTLDF
jgi:ribonucleoside-diphosphate reductase subunit M2